MQFDLILKGGEIVTASDRYIADIGVRDGMIAAIASDLADGERVIDAGGKLVLPGGIDAHCHIDQPSEGGPVSADDFYTGTRSAAFGGTTTVIPFAFQARGQSLRDAVDDYHGRADGKAVIDYAFHLIITDPSPQLVGQDLPALIESGYRSFKVYMTYDSMKINDRQLLDLLSVAKSHGALTMVHAENSDCISLLTERLLAAGNTEPKYHAASRPVLSEREATHRAVTYAELIDVPMYIVHVSSEDAMEQIAAAQRRGLKIHGETCPQYLVLTAEDLDRPAFEGAKYVCSPPPRSTLDQEAMWSGLDRDILSVFSSDHAPVRFGDRQGKMSSGCGCSFDQIPNGVPGIETRMAILFSEGVMKGRLSLQRFVAVTATNPARLFGLYPRKGTIAVGADADLVVWDPNACWTIENADLHHAVDYTPYEGMEIIGRPETVISRGSIVIEDRQDRTTQGLGQFLVCNSTDTGHYCR